MQPNRKFNVLVEAPVFNRSGYGQWADSSIPALIKYPHFNLRVLPSAWGNCVPRMTPGPNDALIRQQIITPAQSKQIPWDIFISVNLPHSAQPIGRIFNINFSAGLEVDRCPDDFMAGGVNRFDLNILMSEFSKRVYQNSRVKPGKPLEILPWAQDLNVFKPSTETDPLIESLMAGIKEPEAFLFVGQRTHHVPEMDRKNSLALIRAYCEAFKNKSDRPALILKINGVNFSNYDRYDSFAIINGVRDSYEKELPIYLLHGELSDHQFAALYNHKKIIACASATRGEGLGGSLLQSSLCAKPAIASNYGGHLDYLDEDKAILVPGVVQEIPDGAVSGWFEKGSKWFEIDQVALSAAFSDFYYKDRSQHIANAQKLAKINAHRFGPIRMETILYSILDKHLFGKN